MQAALINASAGGASQKKQKIMLRVRDRRRELGGPSKAGLGKT
jgi:hypothetical protein